MSLLNKKFYGFPVLRENQRHGTDRRTDRQTDGQGATLHATSKASCVVTLLVVQFQVAVKFVDKKKVLDWVKVRTSHSFHALVLVVTGVDRPTVFGCSCTPLADLLYRFEID